VRVVVDEMQFLKDRYGISHFMWLDDDLFYDENRAINLFNEIIRRQLNITWDASNGVIAASITEDLIAAAYKSGCIGLHLGIESGDPDILKSIHKPSNPDNFKRAAKILKKYPEIQTKGFLMVGFKDETIGQTLKTVELAQELQLDWYPIQILTPFPSTEVYKKLKAEGQSEVKDSDKKFFIGSTGGQRLREEEEREEAKEFLNLLEADPHMIPSGEQIKDIWFLVDYKVNYEKILTENRPIKLEMLQKFLGDVCERVKENPLSTLFLGIVEYKLGNYTKSWELKKRSQIYLNNSEYWQKRFDVLDLNKLL
jgi:radical SAM superfamily enzyme YgiQ (UPF0313 family)